MTLDQLQVLKTIVETGSFRAASGRLNRAQSAISYAIKQLEAEVGVSLFSRDQYRPVLTETGEAFYRQALSVLREQKELESVSHLLKQGVEPRLDLSVTALVSMAMLVPALERFGRRFPFTRLSFTLDVLAADRCVIQGETAIAIAEPPAGHNEFESIHFGEINLLPVMAVKHPLSKSIRGTESDDLKMIPQIILKSNAGGEDRTAGVLHESRSWRVGDYKSKLDLICAGLGWGRMPSHLVEEEIAKKRLKRLDDPVEYRVAVHLFRRRGPAGPAARFLWTELKSLSR